MLKLSIEGVDNVGDRILTHRGTGTLSIENLGVSFGYLYSTASDAYGGCIYSAGSVVLSNVVVAGCEASAEAPHIGEGGGVFTQGDLNMYNSSIVSSIAPRVSSKGGGAFVLGNLTSFYSTINRNYAGVGGGFYLNGGATIYASTISNNSASANTGGIFIGNHHMSGEAIVINSTISGNTAANSVGGIYATISTKLYNSTVAFNTVTSSTHTGFAAGFSLVAGNNTIGADLQSSIISNNTYGSSHTELDFSTIDNAYYSVIVTGANNLITSTSSSIPHDTISSCPLLGPLRDNGGPTLTHALLSHSPAIDMGNAVSTYLVNDYDQRQSGFPRVSPVGGRADIGAYEVQKSDIIFNSSFEGCS